MKQTLSLKPAPGKDLSRYLERYPDERAALSGLADLVQACPQTFFNRTNMQGHIVASGLVLDAALERVLVIEHRLLQRQLPPGGHYEGSGSLVASARREVLEETGVGRLEPLRLSDGTNLLDIDSHAIPANPAKDEGAHTHHDFLYVFQALDGVKLVAQEEEVAGVQWLPFDEFSVLSPRTARIAAKLTPTLQHLQAEKAQAAAAAAHVAPVEQVESSTDLSAIFDELPENTEEGDDDGARDPDTGGMDLTVEDLAEMSLFR